MGMTFTKRVIECDCGCDYGANCGRKNEFLMTYNRSVDIGGVYIDGVYIGHFTDNQLQGFIEVLKGDGTGTELLTKEDREKI